MKNWEDMDKFEKADAIRRVYLTGDTSSSLSAKMIGSTRSCITGFYKRNPKSMESIPLNVKNGIPDEKYHELQKMHEAGAQLTEMVKHFSVSSTTVRRALARLELPQVRMRDYASDPAKGQRAPRMDGWKFRISDAIDTDMGRLIHEGPSPERRAMMAGA